MCVKVSYSRDEAKWTAEHLKQWYDDPKAPLGGRWHVGHNKYAANAVKDAHA